jgi:hypothetical protein
MTQARSSRHPDSDDDLPPLPPPRTAPALPADEVPELDEEEPPEVPADDVPQVAEREEPSARDVLALEPPDGEGPQDQRPRE